jgi:hypothetical protein
MRLCRGAWLSCFISIALLACSGNVKPVAQPARPSGDSVRELLTILRFDVILAELGERQKANIRAQLEQDGAQETLNARQQALFDEYSAKALLTVDDEDSRSESAVVAHFITCAAAAAIANTIRPIQISPRQSLPGDAPESSEGFEAGATKPTTRDSSICV